MQASEKVSMDIWTIVYCAVLGVLAIIYSSLSKKKRRLPPGPVGFPVVGYYPYLRKDALQGINKLWKKYGKIFGFYMGSQYVVVASDWKTISDVCSKVLDRPPDLFNNIPYNFGMAGTNGAIWLESRHLSLKALKDMGLQDARWDYMSQENVKCMIENILKIGEKPIDLNLFSDIFLRNALSPIFGDDELYKNSDTIFTLMKSIAILLADSVMQLGNFSPTLLRTFQILGIEKSIDLRKELMDMQKIVSDTVEQKIDNPSGVVDDSFINQIQHEIKQRNKCTNIDQQTRDQIIKGNVLALLVGGGETTRTVLVWLLIAMAENPEVQKKVHNEVDSVLGKDGTVLWKHRRELPYTVATILEAFRWKTLGPLTAFRKTMEDLEIQSYVIPKGTYISLYLRGLHSDPTYWNEPDRFIPERFLSEDGKDVNMSPDSFAPFSIGKRNCPGKIMALMQMLQYFSIIMQKFKIKSKEGKKVHYDTHLGLTYEPLNVELCFIPRN